VKSVDLLLEVSMMTLSRLRVFTVCASLVLMANVLLANKAYGQERRDIWIILESDMRELLNGWDNGHLELACWLLDVEWVNCPSNYHTYIDGIQLVPDYITYSNGTHGGYRASSGIGNVEGPHQLAGNGKWEFDHLYPGPDQRTYRRRGIATVGYVGLTTDMSGIYEAYILRWRELGIGDKVFDWYANFGPYIEACLHSPQEQYEWTTLAHENVTLVQGSGPMPGGPINISVSYDVLCRWE
jgi:hypothetical protein